MRKKASKSLVYMGYAAPPIMAAVLLVLMLIPCYRFATADGLQGSVSLLELMDNSWDTVREYIFGNGEKNEVTLSFARTLMTTVIVLWTLFFAGLAFAVYALISAVRFFRSSISDSAHALFTALTIGRPVVCALNVLMLPIMLFPRILPLLYKSKLAYEITLITEPFDVLWIALAVFVGVVVLAFFAHPHEKRLGMDIYARKRTAVKEDEEKIEDNDECELDAYELMTERAKAEQAERILRLLEKNKQDDSDGKEEE